MTAKDILSSGFDLTIASAIVEAYMEIESNFVLSKWKPSELDAGHFVEAVRRALDLELNGSYVPINRSLPRFDDRLLRQYEQSTGDQSYRILIPRALKSIYNIRNKRGVAHISDVNPNEMDATLILYTAKWVLAELVRLKSGLPTVETQVLVDDVVERQFSVVWKHEDITWILVPEMSARDQVLVLLYDSSPQTDEIIRNSVGYKNPTNFKKILKRLHDKKLIYYSTDGQCRITSTGIINSEGILKQYK